MNDKCQSKIIDILNPFDKQFDERTVKLLNKPVLGQRLDTLTEECKNIGQYIEDNILNNEPDNYSEIFIDSLGIISLYNNLFNKRKEIIEVIISLPYGDTEIIDVLNDDKLFDITKNWCKIEVLGYEVQLKFVVRYADTYLKSRIFLSDNIYYLHTSKYMKTEPYIMEIRDYDLMELELIQGRRAPLHYIANKVLVLDTTKVPDDKLEFFKLFTKRISEDWVMLSEDFEHVQYLLDLVEQR